MNPPAATQSSEAAPVRQDPRHLWIEGTVDFNWAAVSRLLTMRLRARRCAGKQLGLLPDRNSTPELLLILSHEPYLVAQLETPDKLPNIPCSRHSLTPSDFARLTEAQRIIPVTKRRLSKLVNADLKRPGLEIRLTFNASLQKVRRVEFLSSDDPSP